MAKTIQQNVTFKANSAKLFALYTDSKLHSAATGQKATVGAAGENFSAFGGMITGKILQTVKNKSIVQTWRAKSWKKADPDSILILTFEDTKSGGRVSMVHANVADHDAKGVTAGWKSYYWDPWRKYLRATQKPTKGTAAKKKPAPKNRTAKRKSSR
ncbi:MAG: SRPBCC domain-containing protein [SAR324 cluster bacterium]|nr:SRPBCC domain-containing protein [SAR324 cluster bacterium]